MEGGEDRLIDYFLWKFFPLSVWGRPVCFCAKNGGKRKENIREAGWSRK